MAELAVIDVPVLDGVFVHGSTARQLLGLEVEHEPEDLDLFVWDLAVAAQLSDWLGDEEWRWLLPELFPDPAGGVLGRLVAIARRWGRPCDVVFDDTFWRVGCWVNPAWEMVEVCWRELDIDLRALDHLVPSSLAALERAS